MVYVFVRTIPGLGDMVMLEPAISIFAERHKRAGDEIWVKTLSQYKDIFLNHPHVDRILPEDEPLPKGVKVVLSITRPEECPCAAYESSVSPEITKTRQEVYVEALGLPWDGRAPKLYLSEEEWEEVRAVREMFQGFKVGYQLRAAEKYRTWEHIIDHIRYVRKKTDWNIFMFDGHSAPFIPNTVAIVGRPIREVMKWIAVMDLFVAPDSGLLHIAGALGVRVYGIFGPTDPRVRLLPYSRGKVGQVYWSREFVKCGRSRCWYAPCRRVWCLSLLSPKMVYKDLKKIEEGVRNGGQA